MDGKKRQSVGSADLPSNLAHRALVNEGTTSPVSDEASNAPKSSRSKGPRSPVQHSRKASQTSRKDAGKVFSEETEQKSASKVALAPTELPDFIMERNELFTKLKSEYDEETNSRPRDDIKIVVDTGAEGDKSMVGKSWETTPGQLLRHVSKDVSANVVVAKINGKELWDLDRPLESDCKVSYLPFDSREGKEVFWHSSAHVLGEAAECEYGCLLSHGPPTLQGFFYDMALEEGRVVKETDWPPLNSRANKIFKEKQAFERLDVSKENLKKMFGYSKYKMHYINNLIEGESSTVYRCGTLVDLCRGPHIQNTNKIKAFEINKNSSAYFLGDQNGDSLQRIYGVAFPDKKSLAEHKRYLEEAAKRDHRKLGTEQELFMFDGEVAPGCAFLLPNGTIIFNAIQKMLRSEYQKRGYQEVQSPNMYDSSLWVQSGHWEHYQEDMFRLEIEKRVWGLKPMNCPGHCKIFGHRERSWRELPIRMADFGVLHRNEASGALNGLMRVRKFQQDDTHIFCTQDQVTSEIEGLFDFLTAVYGLFGFAFKLKLSTRPEKYLGDIETWNVAEERLTEALNSFKAAGGGDWELNEGDGAFYGPKIDITISDALKRDHQCATIQLDFQLPQKFKLEYMTGETIPKKVEAEKDPKADKGEALSKKTEGEAPPKKTTGEAPPKKTTGEATPKKTTGEAPPKNTTGEVPPKKTAGEGEAEQAKSSDPGPGRARPVMVHRAIVGSFERFIGILIEHFAGKWPFWLSPRQILVIPVMPAVNDYVEEVQRIFRAEKMHVDIDISGNTLQKKIRRGQLEQYNFIFVVGAQEKETRTVNIRNRDDLNTQSKGDLIPLDEAKVKLKALKKERRLVNSI